MKSLASILEPPHGGEQNRVAKPLPREMKIMHYVYALKSLKDYGYYVGKTENLITRFTDHQNGKVTSTKDRRPLKLVYYEASNSIKDATKREKYLKTAWGKRYLKHRLKNGNA